MKKLSKIKWVLVCCIALAAVAVAQTTIEIPSPGNKLLVRDGGEVVVQDGATLTIESGGMLVLDGTLDVGDPITANAAEFVDLTVTNDATVENDLIVENDATVDGNATVKTDLTVEGDLTVETNATFEGDVTADVAVVTPVITTDLVDMGTFQIVRVVSTVTLSEAVASITTGITLPAGSSVHSINTNFNAAITATTATKVGLGEDGDPDAWVLSANLLKNTKMTYVDNPPGDTPSPSELILFACDNAGDAAGTINAGTIVVEAVYNLYATLPNAD